MKDRSRIREKSEIECIIDFEALYFSTDNKKTNHKKELKFQNEGLQLILLIRF